MHFDMAKCKVMHFSHNNKHINYEMMGKTECRIIRDEKLIIGVC